jgi:hypothetical protein
MIPLYLIKNFLTSEKCLQDVGKLLIIVKNKKEKNY